MPRDGQGNPVHSFGRGRLNDDMHKSRGMKGAMHAAPKEKPEGEEHEAPENPHAGREESPESIHEVVSEHGPAHTIHMHHDHEGGMHTVTSFHGEHHPDKEEGAGFTHHSKHPSHHAAHKHAGHALGIGSPEHEAKESPEFEAGEREGMGEGIPGMS